jgi:hypothetical protein
MIVVMLMLFALLAVVAMVGPHQPAPIPFEPKSEAPPSPPHQQGLCKAAPPTSHRNEYWRGNWVEGCAARGARP